MVLAVPAGRGVEHAAARARRPGAGDRRPAAGRRTHRPASRAGGGLTMPHRAEVEISSRRLHVLHVSVPTSEGVANVALRLHPAPGRAWLGRDRRLPLGRLPGIRRADDRRERALVGRPPRSSGPGVVRRARPALADRRGRRARRGAPAQRPGRPGRPAGDRGTGSRRSSSRTPGPSWPRPAACGRRRCAGSATPPAGPPSWSASARASGCWRESPRHRRRRPRWCPTASTSRSSVPQGERDRIAARKQLGLDDVPTVRLRRAGCACRRASRTCSRTGPRSGPRSPRRSCSWSATVPDRRALHRQADGARRRAAGRVPQRRRTPGWRPRTWWSSRPAGRG